MSMVPERKLGALAFDGCDARGCHFSLVVVIAVFVPMPGLRCKPMFVHSDSAARTLSWECRHGDRVP